jgi:cation-transporting P-type ATPase D
MHAPDGRLLSYTDQKKAMWYVEKGLATLNSTDPISITLKFDPKSRNANLDSDLHHLYADTLYCENRVNQCVACGATRDYARYHIIPALYRTHFPENLKAHRSHDVVLLCIDCHNKAYTRQDLKKKEVAK